MFGTFFVSSTVYILLMTPLVKNKGDSLKGGTLLTCFVSSQSCSKETFEKKLWLERTEFRPKILFKKTFICIPDAEKIFVFDPQVKFKSVFPIFASLPNLEYLFFRFGSRKTHKKKIFFHNHAYVDAEVGIASV